MTNTSNYWYEYSMHRANYYMLHNAICRGTGKNPETGDIFWCFDKQDVDNILADNKVIKRGPIDVVKDKLIYITNLAQSCVYIKEGIKPVDIFFDSKQNKIIFAFRAVDTKEAWAKWKRHEYNL